MTTVFFLMTIVFFFYEFSVFKSPEDEIKRMKRIKEDKVFDQQEGQKGFTKEQKLGCQYVFLIMSYFIWTIIGLTFSSQWAVFGLLIVFGFFIGFVKGIVKRIPNGESGVIGVKRFDGFVSMIILSYIYLNHFHPELLEKMGLIL